jgi:hypothetical protein
MLQLVAEVNRVVSARAFWNLMNPGALPEAPSDCCAFGAKRIPAFSLSM